MKRWAAVLTSRAWTVVAMSLLLAACGGGGGGGGGFLPEPEPAPSYTLNLALETSTGEATSRVVVGRPATLRVEVLENDGSLAPVVNARVNASAEFGLISPENGSTITGSDGIASFEISAGDTAGADTIEVSVDSPGGPVTASINFEIEDIRFLLSTVLLNSDGAVTTSISPDNPGTLRVTLTEDNPLQNIVGEPVADQILTLELSDGVATPANGQALTNEDGVATFGVAAGDTFGAQSATVTVVGPAGPVSAEVPYEVVAQGGGGAAFVSLSIDVTLRDARGNLTNSVSSGAPGTAVAQVLGRTAGSQQRQPVPGVVVTLGAQEGVISPLGGSAVTDGNGQATFTVSAGAEAGSDVLSATVQGPSGPVTDSLVYDIDTATFAATLELLDASGRPTSIIRDGAPVTLRVRVNSTPDGRPVEDAIVQAATTVAALRPANGRAITDRNGEALFELAAGDGAGGDVVDVTIEAESGTIVRSIGYQVLEPRFDISLRLLDADGNDTSLVTTARPAVLRVDIDSLDSPPQPVSGIVASAEAGFAIIRPESGTSLTDAGGVAEFTVQAGETEGADLIRVSVDTGTSVIERTIGVQLNASNLRLGSFAGGVFRDARVGFTVEELPFGGSTRVNLAIIDEQGDLVTTEQEVRLTSDCSVEGAAGFREIGDDGQGQSSLVVAAVQGLVEAEYVASSCEGEDQVRATLVGGTLSATGTLQISSLNANFIGFFSADPSEGPEGGDRTVIALKSTGGAPAGRSETARITFEVLAQRPQLGPGDPGPGDPAYLQDPDRVPLSGARVSFSLTNSLAGITLSDPSGQSTQQGTVSATTNQDGLVTVEVASGEVTAQTFVVASFEPDDGGASIDTTSNQIIVSTGLPDQNSLSLSVEDGFYVPLAANVDGVERVITARLADRFNNPVPDGTSVIFRTEYGAIDSSCLTGQVNGDRLVEQGDAVPGRGTCSVLWVSQNPRLPTFFDPDLAATTDSDDYTCPSHNGTSGPCPDDLGPLRLLRSTVLATVLGEEDFTDLNGNGLFDSGEPFRNLPEAFIDFNEDGVYTPFDGSSSGCVSRFGSGPCEASGAEEEFIDLDRNGLYGDGTEPGTGTELYNGTLCSRNAELKASAAATSSTCARILCSPCPVRPRSRISCSSARIQVVLRTTG